MQTSVIKTLRGNYQPVAWDGMNKSGAHPIGNKVLVKPDKVAEKVGSIITGTADEHERQQLAAESGVLIEVGSEAFRWAGDHKWEGKKPQPGDRVFFARYSGTQVPGADGDLYFFMADQSIGAVMPAAPSMPINRG